ncbi:Nif11-like leader peptide family natural product precursor [Brunnivagina elsteri]|uniref:Uncharacterized protein n=1 Tax=Brunnivagina elsteri CCALA 953 TaxID=987040 RepID=A0A2A2TB16_9CYAN|nr:Nif11-like leader peptide family natural product precursor [Calothrix elsteri]PAX49107.1 hypothetical protein CK510_27820 [Calothrix elsteri CCALA 953]
MSLEQVDAFYNMVASDQGIYEQYYNGCCIRGFFGIWNWDKTKIVDFAASLGFEFTESDLDMALFESGAGVVQYPDSSSGYEHIHSY